MGSSRRIFWIVGDACFFQHRYQSLLECHFLVVLVLVADVCSNLASCEGLTPKAAKPSCHSKGGRSSRRNRDEFDLNALIAEANEVVEG